mgnify:CR=1 FL=1
MNHIDDDTTQAYVALRRDIHQHPEMAFDEHRTSALVAQKLSSLGYSVSTGIGGTGVVGQLVRGTSERRIGLRADMDKIAQQLDIPLTEGVFVSYPGPCFETPAEIRMMQIIGGDVVGMSVVPEVVSAAHCGLPVLAICAITNMAEGLGDVQLSHEQTLKCAKLAEADFIRLINAFIQHHFQ